MLKRKKKESERERKEKRKEERDPLLCTLIPKWLHPRQRQRNKDSFPLLLLSSGTEIKEGEGERRNVCRNEMQRCKKKRPISSSSSMRATLTPRSRERFLFLSRCFSHSGRLGANVRSLYGSKITKIYTHARTRARAHKSVRKLRPE